jgi:thiosulfate dehydrogenase [quinone] large subunit
MKPLRAGKADSLRVAALLYASLILFSAAELIAGLRLMAGFLTRAAALVSIDLSVVLMLMFGWQGATCIDEWTMAAYNWRSVPR